MPQINFEPGQTAERVRSWVEKCEANHEQCKKGPSILPKRVVEIMSEGPNGIYNIRLSEPVSQDGHEAKYTCLSHRWGEQEMVKTTITSLSKHRHSIPWDSLSQTFKDAIDFTSRLGVRFIWIDSLCIIQQAEDEKDDTKKPIVDWNEEAAKMAAYYANSWVTIAASALTDGTEGLYMKSSHSPPLELQGVDEQGRQYHVMARLKNEHPFDNRHYGNFKSSFPLLTRGWVHQEHILSRRFVQFSTGEVLWECASDTTCQCREFDASFVLYDKKTLSKVHGSIAEETNDSSKRKVAYHETWYSNVEDIADLSFTYANDRLAALAGLVTIAAKSHTGRYLAGLWEEYILPDLCWYAYVPGYRTPELQRIPSWSWASVNAKISRLECNSMLHYAANWSQERKASVRIECETVEPVNLGVLSKGVIFLHGLVAKATQNRDLGIDKQVSDSQDFCDILPEWRPPNIDRSTWTGHPDVPLNELSFVTGSPLYVLEMGEAGFYLVFEPINESSLFKRVGLIRSLEAWTKSRGLHFKEWFQENATKMELEVV